MRKVYINYATEFDAAHHLPQKWAGECSNVHGHRYKVEVGLSRSSTFELNQVNSPAEDCVVINFQNLGAWMEEILEDYDHRNLNDSLGSCTPTVENLAVRLYQLLIDKVQVECFSFLSPTVEYVRVWETPNAYAEYRGEMKE